MTGPAPRSLGLLELRTFVVRERVLAETLEFLKEVGAAGHEGFVLWGGQFVDASTLRFTSAVIPDQHGIVTDQGLMVIVDGQALFQVNKHLHERNEVLAGQVHSHPTSAYHSSTDDHYPLVTLLGALSLVVPDFARNAPADREMWAWYRLAEYGVWKPASSDTEVVFIE